MRQVLFYVAATLMLIDAVSYSIGALQPLYTKLAPADDSYLSNRLWLNLMLANAGLYFTAIFTFIGAYLASDALTAARLILLLSVLVCLYSAVTVPILTPNDALYAAWRAIAGILIIIGLFI